MYDISVFMSKNFNRPQKFERGQAGLLRKTGLIKGEWVIEVITQQERAGGKTLKMEEVPKGIEKGGSGSF